MMRQLMMMMVIVRACKDLESKGESTMISVAMMSAIHQAAAATNQPINQSIRTACQWVEQFLIDTHSHTHTDAGLSTEYAAIGTRSCALQHATIQSGVTTAMSRISACLRCSMVEVLAADRWVQMMCVVFSNDR
jgi:hypothetical protein